MGDPTAVTLAGQQAAIETMKDVCTITVPDPEGERVWDEENGVWGAPNPATLYTGKCRVRQPNSGKQAEAGETTFSVSDRIISIPLSGDGYAVGVVGIPIGATVTVDDVSPVGDPAMVGVHFTYISPASQQSHPTARRMLCKGVG